MKQAFCIARWWDHFETPESLKRVKHGSWVSMPNKHDGRGLRRMMELKEGRMIYGVWALIVQVASKMPRRGLLCDLDGPLEPQDLADKIMATKNEVERAVTFTTGQPIGWMKVVEWDESLSFAENVAILEGNGELSELPVRHDGKNSRMTVIRQAVQRTALPASARSMTENRQACGKSIMHDGKNSGMTDEGLGQEAPQKNRLHNRTGQDITIPPTVPKGGQVSDDAAAQIEEAKRRLCLILGGKDPSRPWSYDALHALARLLPIPESEWLAIEWFHGLAPSGEVSELKNRRQSERTLLENWSDEVTRAQAYRKKVGSLALGVKKEPKPEPEGWMIAARKIWPHAPLESFWQLTSEEQRQVRRELAVVV